jgi:hypothetical protein
MRAPWHRYRRRRLWPQLAVAALALLGVLLVIGARSPSAEKLPQNQGATVTPAPSAPSPTAAVARRERDRDAQAALAELPVRGRAPKTGYSREQFGDGWTTAGGCDTRDRMLTRDLTEKTYDPGDPCAVHRGRLSDPYTAMAVTFVIGDASEVDIDHVVALSDAWQKGAQQWPQGRRVRFANDPLNLLSVNASANRQKGDGDAATWLPPNTRFRCEYVARQVAVKRKYKAWTTQAEHDAIARVLAKCPGQELPGSGRVEVQVRPTREAATATPTPVEPRLANGRVFTNCDAARASGAAPLQRGTANYAANPHLDRDGDGVACES